MELLKRLSALLANYTSPFVILTAIVAMWKPELFGWVQSGNVASVILGLIMLTMGCTLSTNDFRILMQRPLDICIGAIAQYTIMPLLAWGLSQLFGLNPFMAAGLILVGCCPGGVSSNIMSFLCHGDVAYSVGMTTVSTLNSSFFDQIDLAKLNRNEKIAKDFTGNKKKVKSSLRALRQLAVEEMATCHKVNVISL